MRIGIVVALAAAALGLPRAVFAQGDEVDPDGGVAEENAPLVIEIVEDAEPALAEAPPPAPEVGASLTVDAAVTVVAPIGDLDPAFLSQLKASLEQVIRETSPAPSRAAELRAAATSADAAVSLILELAPTDGAEPFRETRTASRASALSQARAMAQELLKRLARVSSPVQAGSPLLTQGGATRRRPTTGADAEKAKSTLAVSFIPFLVAGFVSTGVVGLAAALEQDLDLDFDQRSGEPEQEAEEKDEEQDDENSRALARQVSLVVVPITGLIATPIFSLMLKSAHSPDPRDYSVFGAVFLGSVVGIAVVAGLACTLHFATDSAAAVVATSLVGLVVLPPIGGAIGAHVELRSESSRRIAFLPPAPTAFLSPSGRAVPGLAFGGSF